MQFILQKKYFENGWKQQKTSETAASSLPCSAEANNF